MCAHWFALRVQHRVSLAADGEVQQVLGVHSCRNKTEPTSGAAVERTLHSVRITDEKASHLGRILLLGLSLGNDVTQKMLIFLVQAGPGTN